MNTYTLELSNEQLAVLNRALMELPCKEAFPIFNAINEQLAKQLKKEGDE